MASSSNLFIMIVFWDVMQCSLR